MSERVQSYYQMIPRWNYLRYDISAPGFLKYLERRYQLRFENIFYHSDHDTEYEIVISQILKKMAAESKRIIVLNDESDILVDTMKKYFEDRQYDIFFKTPNFSDKGLLFKAPGYHYTVLGNLALAQIVTEIILNEQYIKNEYSFVIKNRLIPINQNLSNQKQFLKNTHLNLNSTTLAKLDSYQVMTEGKERLPSLDFFGIEHGLGIMCGESPSLESFILTLSEEEYNQIKSVLSDQLYQFEGVSTLSFLKIDNCHYDIPGNAIFISLKNDYVKQEKSQYHLSLVDNILLVGVNVVLIKGKYFAQMKPSVYSLKFRISDSLPEPLKNLDFSHPLEIELTSF